MSSIYDKYDVKLKENDFLKRHDECLPYIGDQYDKYRFLIIGESHYVADDEDGSGYLSSIENSEYYKKSIEDINIGQFKENNYLAWINTRTVFTYRKDDEVDLGFFFNLSSEIAKVVFNNPNINYSNQDELKKAFNYFAFINYFKRPSFKEGKEINGITDIDKKYAFEITKHIINVIAPNYIAFVSKKAYDLFKKNEFKDNNIVIKSFSHPSSPWWNRKKNKGKNARQEFSEFLKENLKCK